MTSRERTGGGGGEARGHTRGWVGSLPTLGLFANCQASSIRLLPESDGFTAAHPFLEGITWQPSVGKGPLLELAGAQSHHSGGDRRGMRLEPGPACRRQNQDGEPAPCEVLLIAQVLVCRDEQVEGSLGGSEQLAVRERASALFVGGGDRVTGERPAKWCRCALVEKDPHG